MTIQTIANELRDAYSYIVAPKAMLNTPVEMPDMQKEDEEGALINEYFSIQEVADALGNQFKLVEKIDDRFVTFRWHLDHDDTELDLIDVLKGAGLVDIRATEAGRKLKAKDIDYASLNGNEFGVFTVRTIRDVPNVEVEEVA